jgi:hypothetical protein
MTPQNNLLQAAMMLADMGYRVFPCKPGEKTPATPHGCLDATSDIDQIAEWWTKTPDANIGLSTDGLFVVDVDPLKDGQKNTFADDLDRLSDLLEAGCGSSTPRGGQHFWFRQSATQDLRNTAGQIAEGVDTRGNGGYVLVPPSIINGHPYRWMSGYELDVPSERLPPVPLWILEALSDRPKADPQFVDDGQEIPEGHRNQTMTSIAGMMRRSGLSQRAIESALRATNLERCKPPMDDDEIRKIAWSVGRYEPDQAATAIAEGWAETDAAESRHKEISDPGEIPADLLKPGGLMGAVIEWSIATAFRPQPELSLAATLALMSTITGRKIADTTGLRTNLYCMALCGSGGGKEHTRKVNKDVLRVSGMDELIGPEGIGSHAGILSHLRNNPVQLFQVDEFGRFMATLNNPGKSPHLYNVVGVFLKLFTSADSLFIGDAVADTKKVPKIDQPHAVLYATSVPQSFFESLSKESLSDGFVSRLLIFNSASDPDTQETAREQPPEEIIEACRWWGAYRPGGNLSGVNPQPRSLEWTPDARAILKELEIIARAETKSGRETASLWTRAAEKARKLAILHAVSLDREAVQIGPESANWACWLSHFVTARTEWLAKDFVSENSREATVKRVLRVIRAAGPDGLTTSQLYRQTQWMNARERTEAIEHLRVCGEISEHKEQGKSGRPRTVYTANRYGV